MGCLAVLKGIPLTYNKDLQVRRTAARAGWSPTRIAMPLP
jgi:argininosuccinate lyase